MLTSDKTIKKYILIIAMSLVIILGACALLVYYVDPFFHYHAPLDGFSYVIDNQLTQNPGMAEHMEYDSVILGSSMTVNFETDYFKELMGLNTLKLSYSSAYPKDISNILEKIYEVKDDGSVRKIDTVFLGLDIVTYSGDINETKYPLPEYLYDKNPVNDINYLLNKDVLLNYVLRPIVDPESMNLSHIYASWWTDDYYNEEWVLLNHDAILEPNPEKMPDSAFVGPIGDNLNVNIIPYIKEHPETNFVIFFPPYSILFWNDVIMDNRLEATIAAYECVAEALNAYDNVTMYFFPVMEDTVTNLNNYADYTHYHPSVNTYMTECFVDGSYRIKKDDDTEEKKLNYPEEMEANGKIATKRTAPKDLRLDEYINVLKDMLDTYDFAKLQYKIRQYHN